VVAGELDIDAKPCGGAVGREGCGCRNPSLLPDRARQEVSAVYGRQKLIPTIGRSLAKTAKTAGTAAIAAPASS
jgi:hypothetical protein